VRVLVHGTGSIGMRHLDVLYRRLGVERFALPVRAERGGSGASESQPRSLHRGSARSRGDRGPASVLAIMKREILGIGAEEEADLLWRSGDTTVSIRLDHVLRATSTHRRHR
jgi:hypothetical protein